MHFLWNTAGIGLKACCTFTWVSKGFDRGLAGGEAIRSRASNGKIKK